MRRASVWHGRPRRNECGGVFAWELWKLTQARYFHIPTGSLWYPMSDRSMGNNVMEHGPSVVLTLQSIATGTSTAMHCTALVSRFLNMNSL